ncbi:MAG TPA: triose-phosphate isomerase [Stellaceae bacterium]|jgi:triosephosphate isomerase
MRKLIAGNWKMNGLRADGAALARDLVSRAAKSPPSCDLLVCPPATLLAEIGSLLAGSRIALGGQDCHAEPKGAHTGDVSAPMLKDAGCAYVIVGHSERRQNHHESDATVRAKATAGLGAGLIPIVCVGETAAQRDAKQHLSVCGGQIAGSLPEIAGAGQLVVAYEPVWAIGTGRTPTTTDIAEVHAFIRAELKKRVANPDAVRILYGGSVNAKNAAEILGVANVDGALVGGASLDGASFWTIAQAAG